MIEESLFKVNQIGKDGFIWWLGQVAPYKSWKCDSSIENYQNSNKASKNWPERCKVRIIGYHSFRKSELADTELPWAHVLMDPAFGSGQGGEGMTHNLTGGETCFGFFLDGDDAQQPVIVGLLHRPRNVQNLLEDDEFAFQPFTGHPGGVVPSTKRPPVGPTIIPASTTPTPTPATPTSAPAPSSSAPAPIPASTSTQNNENGTNLEYRDGFWRESSVGFSTQFFTGAGIGISLTNFLNPNYLTLDKPIVNWSDSIFGQKENFSYYAFMKGVSITHVSPSECHKNTIGQITQLLQDFIGFTNGLQKFGTTYIDPVLNEVIDITNSIKSVAYGIGGVIRLVVNSIRSGLIKCLLSLFKKFIGIIIPDPQQSIIAQSANNIINIIFCLFEKLMPQLLAFIEQLLADMVDTVFSAPICAIEQWVSGVLTNVMATIEEAIAPIISGVSWLTGFTSSIYTILNNASNLAAQIYNFIGCDELKCTTPSKWVSTFGPSQMEADNWDKIVNQVNYISGISTNIDAINQEITKSSFYGQSFDYAKCNEAVNNPTTQDDLPFNPIGTRLNVCIPPIITIYGDGMAAKLSPRISNDGSFLSVDILSPGFGYSYPPNLTVIDKSGYGSGARLEAILDKGSIKDVLIVNSGRGYCKPKTIDKNTGVGNTNFDIYENLLDYCQDEEVEEVNEDINFSLSLRPTKRKIYEGESFTIIISSSNKVNPKRVRYQIEGVTKNDIQQNLEGVIELKDGEAKFKIDTIPNDIKDTKKLRFNLKNYNKYTDVVIEDISESIPDKNYKLSSNKLSINEGSSFTIELTTKNVPDGTVVPFKFSGVSEGLIQNESSYVNFAIVNNKSKLKFNTNKGVILNDQLFELELLNKEARIAVIINSITTSESSGEDIACIRELIVRRPGIGYNITDTATDGINTYELIISPDNGAIFGVKPLPQDVCGFTFIPYITINTSTGVGAEILPVMKTDNTNSSSITILGDTSKEPIKVVDCI